MTEQNVEWVDVEVEISDETMSALDELSKVLGRGRDQLIGEAVARFVELQKDASITGHTADEPPTAK
jgi:predicted transcriptional regulator